MFGLFNQLGLSGPETAFLSILYQNFHYAVRSALFYLIDSFLVFWIVFQWGCRLQRAFLFSLEKRKQKSSEAPCHATGRPGTSGFGANPPR